MIAMRFTDKQDIIEEANEGLGHAWSLKWLQPLSAFKQVRAQTRERHRFKPLRKSSGLSLFQSG